MDPRFGVLFDEFWRMNPTIQNKVEIEKIMHLNKIILLVIYSVNYIIPFHKTVY